MAEDIGTTITAATAMPLSLAAAAIDSRDTYKYSKKLMKYQNELNRQNWEATNAYNAPESVMSRYRAAGLNPNLIYGNGTVTPASPLPQPTGGSVKQNMQGAVATGMPALLTKAQIANLSIQNDNLKQDTVIKANQAEGLKLDNTAKIMRMPGIPYELRKLVASALISETEAKWADPEAAQTYALGQSELEKRDQEIKQIEQYIKNLSAEERKTIEETALTEVMEELQRSNIAVNRETVKKIIQETANLAKQGQLLDYQLGNIELGLDPNVNPNIRTAVNLVNRWFGLTPTNLPNLVPPVSLFGLAYRFMNPNSSGFGLLKEIRRRNRARNNRF